MCLLGLEEEGQSMSRKALLAVLVLILLASMMVSAFLGNLKIAKADDQSDSNGDPNSWPMLGGDLSHTGYSTSNAILTNQILWNASCLLSEPYSSPVVSDGIVYMSGTGGTYSGKVFAFDASTGDCMWTYNTQNVAQSSPAVANGIVYVVGTYQWYGFERIGGGTYGNVYALNAISGAKIWSYITRDSSGVLLLLLPMVQSTSAQIIT